MASVAGLRWTRFPDSAISTHQWCTRLCRARLVVDCVGVAQKGSAFVRGETESGLITTTKESVVSIPSWIDSNHRSAGMISSRSTHGSRFADTSAADRQRTNSESSRACEMNTSGMLKGQPFLVDNPRRRGALTLGTAKAASASMKPPFTLFRSSGSESIGK